MPIQRAPLSAAPSRRAKRYDATARSAFISLKRPFALSRGRFATVPCPESKKCTHFRDILPRAATLRAFVQGRMDCTLNADCLCYSFTLHDLAAGTVQASPKDPRLQDNLPCAKTPLLFSDRDFWGSWAPISLCRQWVSRVGVLICCLPESFNH